MQQALALVLLPGLDGSGVLFEPLLALLPTDISVQVIKLSDFPSEDRKNQAQILAQQLDGAPCVIFAESYSGRLAYELALLPDVDIRHIIFSGSFLARPSKQSHRAHWVPVGLLKSRIIPGRLLSHFLFHEYRPDLLDLFYRAMADQSSARLEMRLLNISAEQNPVECIDIPCTYLHAEQDRLVDIIAFKNMSFVCKSLDKVQVSGGHFIAQLYPEVCVDMICKVLGLPEYKRSEHISQVAP